MFPFHISTHILLRILLLSIFVYSGGRAICEQTKKKRLLTFKDLPKKVARDHFLIQGGYENWANNKAGTALRGVHRQFATYGMYDILIKGFPYMSVGLGIGAEWNNFYFDRARPNVNADADFINNPENGNANISSADPNTNPLIIEGTSPNIRFVRTAPLYYNRSKITTIYLQAPLELRYTTDPLNYNKGFKAAVNIKVGYLIRAYSKGVQLKDATQGNRIISNTRDIVRDSRLFSDFQVWGTLRIGWGNIYLFGSYSVLPIFKVGQGPQAQYWATGIGISGL